MKNKPSILITGSSGFLGSKLVNHFSDLGHTVYALDIAPFPTDTSKLKNVHFVDLDITDTNALLSYFADKPRQIDYVIHLAAFWSMEPGYKEIYDKVNLEGTKNMLALNDQLHAKRFIFASSIVAVTATPNQIQTEHTPPNPESDHPYGCSKAACELLIQEHFNNTHLSRAAAIVRLSGIYDDMCHLPPLASVMNLWSKPGPFGQIMPGKGLTGISYLHIDDLADLMTQIIKRNYSLERVETFLAATSETPTHGQLYPDIRNGFGHAGRP